MNALLKNNHDMATEFHWIYPHLERIDLRLQHYYYQHGEKYDYLPESFLLTEDELNPRLAKPQGIPHWVTKQDDIINSPEIDENPNALSQLIERFELTEFERDVLLLGLLPHFDSRYHALFAALHGNSRKQWPSFDLAIELFSQRQGDRPLRQNSFLPQTPLISHQLLRLNNHEESIWLQTQFLTHSAVWHFLSGQRVILPPLTTCAYWHSSASHRWYPQSLYPSLEKILLNKTDEIRPLVILRGKQDSARELAVSNMMALHDISTLTLDLAQLPEENNSNLLIDAVREARLHDACLLIRNFSLLKDEKKILHSEFSTLLNQAKLRVVCLAEPQDSLVWIKHLPIVQINMPALTLADKKAMLEANLSDNIAQKINITQLCQRFSFTAETLPQILQEANQYQILRQPEGQLEETDLRKALSFRAQQNFGKLAQRITPKRSLNDLVISDVLTQQLKEIIAAIHYRDQILATGFQEKIGYGTGISALFYGESGTGKTMAAEVIAGHLGVDLIKVDLSTVVNKYIGETEKNISRIFDLAEADSGVLFFDEADALFGKRSETKDAQDRHANIEVSYLLQRLENYPGLVILATNNRSHLDSAFNRRFTFITRFAYPDEMLRKKMWQVIWPEQIKLSDTIDFTHLAKRADLTGANIRNIALLASMLAKNDHCDQIENKHINRAITLELNKTGRLVF
ncbi:AAA family ATPase [Photorhabdus laumondii subsp. laumondii]|uniref:Photorhabdus luminescens subsp. laumondii TTO1 complete genome segment 6/17 n=2 Tax=Photorhabdus laumondii subsp. laumondii TaxID=141679 RepID=Q7N672_PHOLL|nr:MULTISPECIES: AAA family ATPase [Photorhabdus]AWK41535.1 AAA family ATPase [Photorhabdus laumondii subsp. laumondii]AXG42334.1 ATP-binding protein [Photorhabdus laumondii subsp. laumondii]AXG46857.1 ATP-binding protein [Photorhabdus laumondii subsp. laumondii]KTL61424.1 AAA family ATPase [Photorhabdus laumondii subsp. laumondii]MCC8382159.1 ATP-binding protein [Photorhabdus laumondii]